MSTNDSGRRGADKKPIGRQVLEVLREPTIRGPGAKAAEPPQLKRPPEKPDPDRIPGDVTAALDTAAAKIRAGSDEADPAEADDEGQTAAFNIANFAAVACSMMGEVQIGAVPLSKPKGPVEVNTSSPTGETLPHSLNELKELGIEAAKQERARKDAAKAGRDKAAEVAAARTTRMDSGQLSHLLRKAAGEQPPAGGTRPLDLSDLEFMPGQSAERPASRTPDAKPKTTPQPPPLPRQRPADVRTKAPMGGTEEVDLDGIVETIVFTDVSDGLIPKADAHTVYPLTDEELATCQEALPEGQVRWIIQTNTGTETWSVEKLLQLDTGTGVTLNGTEHTVFARRPLLDASWVALRERDVLYIWSPGDPELQTFLQERGVVDPAVVKTQDPGLETTTPPASESEEDRRMRVQRAHLWLIARQAKTGSGGFSETRELNLDDLDVHPDKGIPWKTRDMVECVLNRDELAHVEPVIPEAELFWMTTHTIQKLFPRKDAIEIILNGQSYYVSKQPDRSAKAVVRIKNTLFIGPQTHELMLEVLNTCSISVPT